MGKAMGTGLKGAFTLGNIPLPPPERFTIGRWNCYSKDFKAEGYTLALAAETGEETFPLLQIFHWDENSLWIQKQVLEHECLYG